MWLPHRVRSWVEAQWVFPGSCPWRAKLIWSCGRRRCLESDGAACVTHTPCVMPAFWDCVGICCVLPSPHEGGSACWPRGWELLECAGGLIGTRSPRWNCHGGGCCCLGWWWGWKQLELLVVAPSPLSGWPGNGRDRGWQEPEPCHFTLLV